MNEETFIPIIPVFPSISPEIFTLALPFLFWLAAFFAIGSLLVIAYHWLKYAGNFPLAIATIALYGGGVLFLLVALETFILV